MRNLQRAQRPAWWVPAVRYTHPNYATVLLGETVVHGGLAVAAFCGSHQTGSWYWFNAVGHGWFSLVADFGVIHGLIAALLLIGVYRRWPLVRQACLLSVAVYIFQAVLFVAAVVRGYQTVPLEGVIYNIGLILLSAAAYKEPVVPGRYDARDRA